MEGETPQIPEASGVHPAAKALSDEFTRVNRQRQLSHKSFDLRRITPPFPFVGNEVIDSLTQRYPDDGENIRQIGTSLDETWKRYEGFQGDNMTFDAFTKVAFPNDDPKPSVRDARDLLTAIAWTKIVKAAKEGKISEALVENEVENLGAYIADIMHELGYSKYERIESSRSEHNPNVQTLNKVSVEEIFEGLLSGKISI